MISSGQNPVHIIWCNLLGKTVIGNHEPVHTTASQGTSIPIGIYVHSMYHHRYHSFFYYSQKTNIKKFSVQICMYVWLYLFVHAHMHVYLYTCMYVWFCVYVKNCKFMYVCIKFLYIVPVMDLSKCCDDKSCAKRSKYVCIRRGM